MAPSRAVSGQPRTRQPVLLAGLVHPATDRPEFAAEPVHQCRRQAGIERVALALADEFGKLVDPSEHRFR
jgi:hypothetical protein